MIQGKAVSTTIGWWTTTIAIFLTLFLHHIVIGDDAFAKADVDALVDPLIENREVVGLVIGVVYEGERYIFSYGSLKREGSKVPDGKTIFEIGSITKPFTGLLLAKLVDEGKVKLDDPIINALYCGVEQLSILACHGRVLFSLSIFGKDAKLRRSTNRSAVVSKDCGAANRSVSSSSPKAGTQSVRRRLVPRPIDLQSSAMT